MEARAETRSENAARPRRARPAAAPLRTAVIGLGVMGRNHLRVAPAVPGLEVVAVCDPRLSPGDAPRPVHADHRRLLDAERLDACIIATPTGSHPDIAQDCLARGLHLLVEKPVTGTSEAARRLAEAAAASGGRVAVGHVERFNPAAAALRRALRGQELLGLRLIRVGPLPNRIMDVGVLTDLAVHDVDLVRFLTGQDVVRSRVRVSRRRHPRHEDHAALSLELASGVRAEVVVSWLASRRTRRIEAITPRARYVADLLNRDLREWPTDRPTAACLLPVDAREPLTDELAAFARLAAGHGWGDLATIDDSLRTLEIIGR